MNTPPTRRYFACCFSEEETIIQTNLNKNGFNKNTGANPTNASTKKRN